MIILPTLILTHGGILVEFKHLTKGVYRLLNVIIVTANISKIENKDRQYVYSFTPIYTLYLLALVVTKTNSSSC